jgi:hypothetical protein
MFAVNVFASRDWRVNHRMEKEPGLLQSADTASEEPERVPGLSWQQHHLFSFPMASTSTAMPASTSYSQSHSAVHFSTSTSTAGHKRKRTDASAMHDEPGMDTAQHSSEGAGWSHCSRARMEPVVHRTISNDGDISMARPLSPLPLPPSPASRSHKPYVSSHSDADARYASPVPKEPVSLAFQSPHAGILHLRGDPGYLPSPVRVAFDLSESMAAAQLQDGAARDRKRKANLMSQDDSSDGSEEQHREKRFRDMHTSPFMEDKRLLCAIAARRRMYGAGFDERDDEDL